jgi:hypothetical protein|tara:strand:- start:1346 stop:1699 length:354 start_codon:yes stop_codon:yes gene_type:complete
MSSSASARALDRLKKAANLTPAKRIVVLSNGDEFEFWSTPLTMAERERAQKQANSDDANQYALQLLIHKATDENGQRMFKAGELAELKNEVRDEDLQALMVALVTGEGNVTEDEAKK